MLFRPDKAILAGCSGSFAPCPLPALAGRHDAGDVIYLPRRAVNNPNPAMQSERVVSKNPRFRDTTTGYLVLWVNHAIYTYGGQCAGFYLVAGAKFATAEISGLRIQISSHTVRI